MCQLVERRVKGRASIHLQVDHSVHCQLNDSDLCHRRENGIWPAQLVTSLSTESTFLLSLPMAGVAVAVKRGQSKRERERERERVANKKESH